MEDSHCPVLNTEIHSHRGTQPGNDPGKEIET